MLPYIIALLCRETEGGTYGNDEVLHLTDKVQSLSKKSAGNRPANTSSLMNYIKSLSGNTKGMVLYGRVKEELIRRGVIAVYEKTVVWR